MKPKQSNPLAVIIELWSSIFDDLTPDEAARMAPLFEELDRVTEPVAAAYPGDTSRMWQAMKPVLERMDRLLHEIILARDDDLPRA
jgi:hypothetical protein